MRISVPARQLELASDANEALSLWNRFRGLMGRRGLAAGGGLVIRPCNSIHMMFMRFPIDAVFYDRHQRVTRVARNLRTWRGFAVGGRSAHAVIELPVGAADGVEPGDELVFDR